jgi:hypothetical protein
MQQDPPLRLKKSPNGSLSGSAHPKASSKGRTTWSAKGSNTTVVDPAQHSRANTLTDPEYTANNDDSNCLDNNPLPALPAQVSEDRRSTKSRDTEGPEESVTTAKEDENSAPSSSRPSSLRRKSKNDGRIIFGAWKLGKTIGTGSSGSVKMATHVATGQLVNDKNS